MEQDDWTSGSQAIGMYLNGDGIAGKDARGRTITDDHFLLYFNADGPAQVTLPPEEFAKAWDVVIDTSGAADSATTLAAGSTFELDTRTVVVLQEHAEPEAEPDHSVAASVAALSQTTASPAADQRSGSRPTKAPDA
jgi:isoamylase